MKQHKVTQNLKRLLAFVLAAAMLLSQWSDYGAIVWAAQDLTGTPVDDPQEPVADIEDEENAEEADQPETMDVKSLDSSDIEIQGVEEQCYYTGAAIEFSDLKVLDGQTELASGTDYTVTYSNHTNVTDENSPASVTITGCGNYTGTITKEFQIVYYETTEAANVSGTTKDGAEEDWYAADTVTLSAPDGWEISQSQTADWAASLEVTANASQAEQVVTYYLKEAGTGYVTDQKTVTFYVDAIAPVITQLSAADAEQWTTSKTVSITVDEAHVKEVFCTKATDASPQELTLDENGQGSLEITDALDENGEMYTFTVVDQAGNTATDSITVKKIDGTAPTISVSMDGNAVAENETIYTNEIREFQITCTDEENGSGIDETTLQVTKQIGSNASTVTAVTDQHFSMEEADQDQTILYTVTVSDNSGRTKSSSFTVVYDVTEPEITNQGLFVEKDGTDEKSSEPSVNADDILWVNETDGTLKWKLTTADPLSGVQSVKLYRAGETTPVETFTSSTWNGVVEISDQEYSGLYRIVVTDQAGNESTKEQYVKVDRVPATISDPAITGTNNADDNNLWYNTQTVTLRVSAGSALAGIQEVFASTDGSVTDIAQAEHKLSMTATGQDGQYEAELTDADFEWRTYYFYVLDEAGNVAKAADTVTLRRDSQAPDVQESLISFTAPELDENAISYTDITDNGQSLIKKLQNFVNNLFGKKMVTATLYIPDKVVTDAAGQSVFSGTKTLVLSYDGQEYTVAAEEGYHAYQGVDGVFSEDTASGAVKAYSVFNVELPTRAGISEEEISSRIQITEVTDYAGNTCQKDAQGIVMEMSGMILLDDVAPKLTKVTYPAAEGEYSDNSGSYYFYQTDSQVEFEIQEKNFEGVLNNETPRRPVYTKYTGEASGQTETLTWTYDAARETAAATAEFAAVPDTEVEYHYTLSYRDPSGNALEGGADISCTQGVYTSSTVVLDDVPPVLKAFFIESNGSDALSEEDGLLYAKSIDGDDVKITVVIDDNDKYFDKSAVKLEYSVDGTQWQTVNAVGEWQVSDQDDREHTFVYTFDGLEQSEFVYQFRISYHDRANHAMILSDAFTDTVEETADGTYTSAQKVVLDHAAPKLSQITFTDPVQIVDGEQQRTQITDQNTMLYYTQRAALEFVVKDAYLEAENVQLHAYARENAAQSWTLCDAEIQVSKSAVEGGSRFAFVMPEDDQEYYFTISYTDRAGNALSYATDVIDTDTIGEAYAGGIVDAAYTTPVFVKDSTAPVYQVQYAKEPAAYNAVDSVQTVLTVTETNFDLNHTIVVVTAKDKNGNRIQVKELDGFTYDSAANAYRATWAQLLGTLTSNSENTQKLQLNLSTEANYVVQVTLFDKAGNTASYTKSYCIDRTAPSITVATKDGKKFTDTVKVSCGLLDFTQSDVTYEVSNQGTFARIINKLTFGYFAKQKMIVKVAVHDAVSGTAALVPTCLNEGKKVENYKLSGPKTDPKDQRIAIYEIELPLDFKGTVQMHGVDRAGNAAKDTGAIGMIIESESQHERMARASVEVLTGYSKTPTYYAGDVEVQFSAVDGYSGFYEISYQAGNAEETITYPAGEAICTETDWEHTIRAAENNDNEIALALEFTDHAGHTKSVAADELPVINIDQTAPEIEVVYDNQDALNEKYYKEPRTATITITERNFDPGDTVLDITGPNAAISEWSHSAGTGCSGGSDPDDIHHSDDCQWVATVTFEEDGDYTFTCSTVDLAGNEAAYGQIDDFVIDQTIPKIEVIYDNMDVQNELYYNAPRTATITITERNFEPADVKLLMTAQSDGAVLPEPSVSAWSGGEESWHASVAFDYDAEFTFDIEYTDLAGNEAEDYTPDEFVVDLTPPEIEIYDIEDRSANNGVVAPGIHYSDTNYDAEGTVVEMVGYRNGLVEMTGSRSVSANGVELKLEDFEYVPEMDDMYTMNAVVYDLAGNSSEASIMFSVNRFGSVYTFDQKTEALVGENGSYYTDQEQALVIYETNVDTLEFQEITLNLNGELRTLEEGADFKVSESGSEESWKQYTYQLPKDNFAEEGLYILTIYSEDRASNVSDNHTKGKEIEFVVDKTKPSVLVTGVEDKAQYREDSRKITVDIEDNIRVGSAEITLNGETTVYTAAQIAETDGQITFTAGSANDWQTLGITVYDAAGNCTKLEEMTFLITANVFVQFYMNRPLFFGAIGGVAVIGGVWWSLAVKKRKIRG